VTPRTTTELPLAAVVRATVDVDGDQETSIGGAVASVDVDRGQVVRSWEWRGLVMVGGAGWWWSCLGGDGNLGD
jgi:hypothetical protein